MPRSRRRLALPQIKLGGAHHFMKVGEGSSTIAGAQFSTTR